MRTWVAGLLVVFGAGLFGSCSNHPGPNGDVDYALRRPDQWRLKKARDPKPDDRVSNIDRPPLDWYEEYESVGAQVRVSGHAVSRAEAEAAMKTLGFRFEPIRTGEWRGEVGSSPEGDAGARVVVLDGGHRSVIVLSYELTTAEVVTWAAALESVDRRTWVAAGGVIER